MKKLAVTQLKEGMRLAQDVYLSVDATTPVLRNGVVLSPALINRLLQLGIRHVYIEDGGGPDAAPPEKTPVSPARQVARTRVQPTPLAVGEKLREDTLQSLTTTFSDILIDDAGIGGTPKILAQMHETVAKLVGSLSVQRQALTNIANLKSFDEFTYHHSLSVAVLAIAIGQYMGLSTRELNRLGLSAILHDIGKMAVPLELLHKPAVFSQFEFEQMKQHSRAGSTYLAGTRADEDLWQAVLFHHERMDGSGYPSGMAGNRIPLYSRIISVADVYDALTSVRPHRPPMQPADTLEYVMGGVGQAFDYDVVLALVQKVALYPVGCCVELSDRSYAMVVEGASKMRPVVEILGRGDVVDLDNDRQYLNVVVRRILPEAELLQLLDKL